MKEISCSHIRLITRIIAIACITGMLLSYKLWSGERSFPLSPVLELIPSLPKPFDSILFGFTLILLLLISISRNPQKYIIAFLVCALILAILDQNRWQPWFYQYLLMFFVLSFFNYRCDDTRHLEAIKTIFKLLIAAVYFWSGLQKMNPNFVADTYPWLMEPLADRIGETTIKNIDWFGNLFPIIETLTGIALFFSPVKKVAVVLLLLMHLFILFVLGPFGHNYNPVVWPWNIAMMGISFILFFNNESISISQIMETLRYHSLKIVFALFLMLPLFNFVNLWDSYLSHNLYSGNTSNGVIYISDSLETKLPEKIRKYSLGELNQNQITIKYWCMMELGVPAYPEKRNFESITSTFYKYATDSSEVYLLYTPKLKVSDRP